MPTRKDFLLIGAQEPMEARLKDNSNIFHGIPPYFTPYGKDFLKMSARAYSFPAYALPILAASLERKKYSVGCINDFYQETETALIKTLKRTKCAAGISTTFLTNKDSIIRIARFIRKANPSLTIMMGGSGMINFPEARRYADINIFYEGEETIEELSPLLSRRSSVSGVKGISYFRRGKEVLTGKRECIADLGRIPLPDWGLLIDRVREERYLPIESSRGCVGRCSFCLERQYWPGVRFYPIERVIEELKADISGFGIRHYYFQDSNISNSRVYLARLCDTFCEERLKIFWSCESRIDAISEDLVDRMFKAGCRAITFGMESADRGVLQNMNKGLSEAKMKEFMSIVKHMRAIGMIANINIIVGFPGETKESVQRTIDFLLEAKPIAYSMSKFFLERGTDIWKNRKKFGLRGGMYKWEHNGMKSAQLDDMLRRIFTAVSKDLDVCHWTSASVDLVRHMSMGKSVGAFVEYLKSINRICIEDLIRKTDNYSSEYDKSFRYITQFLS